MSDLHCPARLVVVAAAGPGALEAAAGLAAAPSGEAVARVWTAPDRPARAVADVWAAALGTDVVERDGLRDAPADPEGAVGRVRAVLEEAADLHRGETVLVVTHPAPLAATLPVLLGAAGAAVPPTGRVDLERDADGWRVR